MSITIHKKIVLDEHNKPVEVIIDYAEWTKIERILEPGQHGMVREKLKDYAGIVHIEEEPLTYQRRVRSEGGRGKASIETTLGDSFSETVMVFVLIQTK